MVARTDKRDDFPAPVSRRVAMRAGYLCSNPDCQRLTVGPSQESPDGVTNLGEAAHICAASAGGPRFDPMMSAQQRTSIANAIWLCCTCHKLVDDDTTRFHVQKLQEWKQNHESRMSDSIAGRRAALDRRNIEAISQIVGVPESQMEMLVEPSISQSGESMASDVEFIASAMYSSEKNAVIVVAELGNGSSRKIAIRDVRLLIDAIGEFEPHEVMCPTSFYVEGHQWLGSSPFPIKSGDFAKVAWYFCCEGNIVRDRLAESQPLPCELKVSTFPNLPLSQWMDLFSISRLREMNGAE